MKFKVFILLFIYYAYDSYQVAALSETSRPLNVFIKKCHLCLETKMFRFQSPVSQSVPSLILDLYSMVHVGDTSYYEQIEKVMEEYDIVLYELITSKNNVIVNNEYQKKLTCDIYPSKMTQALAKKFELQTQLCLPTQSANWYIADLDVETITDLEKSRKTNVSMNYWLSLVGGRGFNKRTTLNKFFMSDNVFITLLRILLFIFVPCPELSCLLLDWSRMTPKGNVDRFTTKIMYSYHS